MYLVGSKNLGLAKLFGIDENQLWFSHPNDPTKRIYWIYDILHLLKNIRNHLLDDEVILPGNFKVSITDFYDLLEKIKTDEDDHTSGFHLSEEDLLVESQDRQDVASCLRIFNERTSACFQKYFPKNNAKQALAEFISCCVDAHKVATSRVMLNKSDNLRSALGMFYEVNR